MQIQSCIYKFRKLYLLISFSHGQEAKFKFEVFFNWNREIQRTSTLTSFHTSVVVIIPFASTKIELFASAVSRVEVVPENS